MHIRFWQVKLKERDNLQDKRHRWVDNIKMNLKGIKS